MKTISKSFPDLGKSFALFRIAEEVDFLTGQQSEHNMLALSIHQAFCNKRPIRDVLGFVLECYKDNPEAVVDILGETLINKIKTTLYED